MTSSPSSPHKTLFECDLTHLGRVEFKSSKSNDYSQPSQPLACQIYSIRLGHLLPNKERRPLAYLKLKRQLHKILGLKRSRDLVHTVAALYDNCLPDIGASSVYDCVTAAKAYTVLVLKDEAVVNDDEVTERGERESETETNEFVKSELSSYESDDCLSSVMEEGEVEEKRVFKRVFSDEEGDGDEESDEDDELEDAEEDNTAGVKSFLKENGQSKVCYLHFCQLYINFRVNVGLWVNFC
jgi:hypothetical protein